MSNEMYEEEIQLRVILQPLAGNQSAFIPSITTNAFVFQVIQPEYQNIPPKQNPTTSLAEQWKDQVEHRHLPAKNRKVRLCTKCSECSVEFMILECLLTCRYLESIVVVLKLKPSIGSPFLREA